MKTERSTSKLPPLWLYKLVSKLRMLLQKMYYALVPANVAVYEMSQQFWLSKMIGVSCELNLSEIVGDESLDIANIAREAGADTESLYRLMRALSSEGIFREEQGRKFSNTARSYALIGGPGSMKYMIKHQLHHDNWSVVGEMKYSVQTGKSAVRKLFGKSAFEQIAADPERNSLYNLAMNNTSNLIAQAAISAYDFSKFSCLADIGGGTGRLLASILSRHPRMKGVLLDWEHVLAGAPEVMKSFGVEERVEIVKADFFEQIPPDCDAYILKNILHIFDDEHCIRLLQKIREQAKPGARILILEMLLGPANQQSYGKMFDLQMLLGPDGARERTAEDYRALFEKSAWKSMRVVEMVSPFAMLEAQA
jgi:ubiquinone/menaquinone biosynthesis C-methylase UbiE